MRRKIIVMAIAVACIVTPSLTTSSVADPAPTNASVKDGKLSPRLQQVSQPGYTSLDPQTKAAETSSLEDGPGSLATTGAQIVVEIQIVPGSDPSPISTVATIQDVSEDGSIVTASIDPTQLQSLAALPTVTYVGEAIKPITHAACPTGPNATEGLTALKADLARTSTGATGAGITVGVISNSYNAKGGAAASVASGELPGTGNPCGYSSPVGLVDSPTSGSDEGRAMAEIIHDIAPAAKIIFASYGSTESQMANNIRKLAAQGAKVIVDDVTYYGEPMYQDGVLAKAVADVTAQGVAYFSSAGNFNSQVGGRDIGGYATQAFRGTTCPSTVTSLYNSTAIRCHDFDPGSAAQTSWQISFGGSMSMVLGWNEPQYGVQTDLDLCLLDPSTNAIITCGWDKNSMSKRAFEWASIGKSGSARVVVVRSAGAASPAFRLVNVNGTLTASDIPGNRGGDTIGATAFGHNVSAASISVGAHPYYSLAQLESFSSAGPSLACWNPVVGTTPATKKASCSSSTVDITATDGGRNSFFGSYVGGIYRFFGTSAAAPHAAAVAALMKQAAPCLTPAQSLSILQTTARPISGVGANRQGSGIIDAQEAVWKAQSTCGTATAGANPQGALASFANANGDIYIDGWAFDADAISTSTTVMVTVGGQVKLVGYANAPSPQLYQYGVPGNHGIKAWVQGPASGSTQVCLFVLNIGPGANTTVACRTVTVPGYDPQGAMNLTRSGNVITSSGWAFDQSNFGAPVTVMLTLNGAVVSFANANLPSPELYPFGVPGSHGFRTSFGTTKSGSNQVCMFVFNIGGGKDVLTGCKNISI